MTFANRHRNLLITGGLVLVTVGLLDALWGNSGVFIGVLLSILTVAFRHDNKAGLYFPLALLFVMSVVILSLLLALLTFVLP